MFHHGKNLYPPSIITKKSQNNTERKKKSLERKKAWGTEQANVQKRKGTEQANVQKEKKRRTTYNKTKEKNTFRDPEN